MKDRVKKGAAVLGQVWNIGKRRIGNDWERRLWLFNLLASVMEWKYGDGKREREWKG